MQVDFTKALAGVTALAAGLAALGSATGTFDQMQRNAPQWSAAVFGTAVLAGILVVGAGLADGWLQTLLISLALVAFLFAGVAGIFQLVETHGRQQPPSLEVTLKAGSQPSLSGTIKAQDMTSTDDLTVRVLAEKPSADGDPNGQGGQDNLLNATSGADASGNASFPLDVSITPKRYRWVTLLAWVRTPPSDCFKNGPAFDTTHHPGCVVVRVPPPGGLP